MVSVTLLIGEFYGDSAVVVQVEWPGLVSCICSFNLQLVINSFSKQVKNTIIAERESQFIVIGKPKFNTSTYIVITVLPHPCLVFYKTIATVFSF